jgi:hypothetical protein
LWFGFFALTSPLPPGPDVFVFRDAGCNWAHGIGLVAASVPHANTVNPRLFASYTPGAPLLFGLGASIFGCSGWFDTFYNLALAASSCRQRIWAALLLGALLPTGMVAFDGDRPEMPAFCLMVAILLGWRKTRSVAGRALLLGCVGLVFLIHPFAGIVGWLLLAFLLIFGEPRMPSGRLQVMAAGTALFALIVAAWVLSMWWQDHTALHRFLEHAAGKGTGAGVVVHSGYAAPLRQLFNPAFPASAALAFSLLVSGVVVAGYAFRTAARVSLLLQCAFLLTVLLIFPFAVFPGQTNYLGLARALLVAVLLIGGFPLAGVLRGSAAPLSLLLIAFVFLAPWVGLEALQNVEARSSYYHEEEQAQRVGAYFAQHGVRNPSLLADSGHYFVYKPYFPDLYNRNYVEPGDAASQVQGLIVCYSGSRAFSRAQLPQDAALQADSWKLIDDGEDAVRVTLFGHSIMRRNWTWMCDAYARQ